MLQIKNSGYILLIITLFAGSISCKEDDTAKNNRANILGTWQLQSISNSECNDMEENGTQTFKCPTANCVEIEFYSDSTNENQFNKITTIEGQESGFSGVYVISDTHLSLCEEDDGNITCDKYSLIMDASTMTMTRTETDSGCTSAMILSKISED